MGICTRVRYHTTIQYANDVTAQTYIVQFNFNWMPNVRMRPPFCTRFLRSFVARRHWMENTPFYFWTYTKAFIFFLALCCKSHTIMNAFLVLRVEVCTRASLLVLVVLLKIARLWFRSPLLPKKAKCKKKKINENKLILQKCWESVLAAGENFPCFWNVWILCADKMGGKNRMVS